MVFRVRRETKQSSSGLILLNERSMPIRVREIEVKTITRSKHTSGAHTHIDTQHVMPRQEAVVFCVSTSPVGVKPQSGLMSRTQPSIIVTPSLDCCSRGPRPCRLGFMI